MKDIDAIKKVPEADRTKRTLMDALQVSFTDDHEDNAGFWDVSRWNDASIKTRVICLAIMKKIIQRDDRYAVHNLECCTDIESLYRHIQPAFDYENAHNTNNAGNKRQWNNIGNLFTPSTKRNGKPSTIYTLLSHKLDIQIQIAADFVATEGSSLDALEDFFRLDAMCHSDDYLHLHEWLVCLVHKNLLSE